MSTNSPADPPVRRIDRILAFMALGIAVISVLCLFAIIIATGAGLRPATGVWPIVAVVPMVGLPIAFLLILALLITSIVRRGKAGRS